MKRNVEIDRLRAVAVVATVYAHVRDLWLWPLAWLDKGLEYSKGYDGVLLFFLHFRLRDQRRAYSTARSSVAAEASGAVRLAGFFVKRLFRITPSCLLWVIFLLAVVVVIDSVNRQGNVKAAVRPYSMSLTFL